ncbi:putative membrane protein YdfJ with MMPL/SSD domain [Cellulomonas sp. URHB0016]
MRVAPRQWYRRHRATVALASVALAVALGLGLTAPATSPVSEGRPAAPGTAGAPVHGP